MSYRIEWIWPVAVLGVLTPLMIPWFGAMLAVVVVLLVALAILVALVGAIVATPFLLVRAANRRRRSGRALPANNWQPSVSRPSLLTAAGRQAAAPTA